jgi:hypothetical protein
VPTAVNAASGDKQAQMQLIGDVAKLAVKSAKNKRKRERKKQQQTLLATDSRVMASAPVPQPLAYGSQFRTVKPEGKTVTRKIGGQTVTGTSVTGSELLQFVHSPSGYSGTYFVQAYEIAPRFGVLPLLDQISTIYKRYSCDSIALKFFPFVPTTTAGRMGLYASSDPASTYPTSFTDFMRLTQQQTANIYSDVVLQISPNAEGSYLPGPDSTLDSANVRQTFTCQAGYAFEAPASAAVVQLGAIVCAYEFFFWDLVDPASVINPADYMLTMKVPAGENVQAVKQFAPFWIRSTTNPGTWKFLGSNQDVTIEIQGLIEGDASIEDYLPKLYNPDGTPTVPSSLLTGVYAYSALTNANTNVVAAGGTFNLSHGSLLIFPDIIAPFNLKAQIQFSRVSQAAASIFDF